MLSRAPLYDVQVVLVSPKNPQNIGSVLRASGNFGVREVRVVLPRCDLAEDTVTTVACSSPSTLSSMSSLQEALADSTVSLAFSRRKGKGRQVMRSLRAFLANDDNNRRLRGEECGLEKIALVFGREESGLEADEILLCSHTVEIPSNPLFPSLNLSHAVAVILSQLYEYRCGVREGGDGVDGVDGGDGTSHTREVDNRDIVATHAEINSLYGRIVGLLERQGIDTAESRGGGDAGSHGRRIRAPGHLKGMLLKSRASQIEVRSLFKLVKELEESIEHQQEN